MAFKTCNRDMFWMPFSSFNFFILHFLSICLVTYVPRWFQVQIQILNFSLMNHFLLHLLTHNPTALQTQPLQTNLRKPHVSITLIILPAPLLITTLTPITQFLPTPTLGTRALPTQTQSNPYHQDTISVGNTLLYNHPPTLHNTTTRMISHLQKSNRTHIILLFYTKK